MTTPTASELPRHVHYCKDFASSGVCADRGYCECECGARVVAAPAEAAGVWTRVPEWKEPAK